MAVAGRNFLMEEANLSIPYLREGQEEGSSIRVVIGIPQNVQQHWWPQVNPSYALLGSDHASSL